MLPILSVLDQSLSRTLEGGSTALRETLSMAKWCEELGYKRFWVSEHHAFPSVAGSAPEILLAALGAATSSIRLGSGGIMLPHYSAYKVAEQFSVLANLYPGRIDLGVGRAPGADMSTAVALANDGRPKFERFPKQVTDLCSYLWDENTQPMVSPRPPKDLPVWMLGSSADSAQLAALKGLPYNLAAFINPQASSDLIRYYRQSFQPSARCPSPYAVLTMSIFCAETEARAEALAHTFDINFYRFVTGQSKGSFLTPEEAASYPMTAELKGFKQHRSQNRAVGTPDQVKLLLARQARIFEVDEIMAVSNIHNLEDRKRSFELLINN